MSKKRSKPMCATAWWGKHYAYVKYIYFLYVATSIPVQCFDNYNGNRFFDSAFCNVHSSTRLCVLGTLMQHTTILFSTGLQSLPPSSFLNKIGPLLLSYEINNMRLKLSRTGLAGGISKHLISVVINFLSCTSAVIKHKLLTCFCT